MSNSKIADYICWRFSLESNPTKIETLMKEYTQGSIETKKIINIVFETLTKQSLESIINIVSKDWKISEHFEKPTPNILIDELSSKVNSLTEDIKLKDTIIEELRTNYWNLKESVNKKLK